MPPTTNSDSEDDLDYVPPADEYDSESSDDHFELGTATESLPVAPLTDPTEQKKQRDALWASFQASVVTPPSNSTESGNRNGNGTPVQPPSVKRVKIEKTYLFAGKHVTEAVEVPEDSEDAKKWPRWSPRPPTSDAGPTLLSEHGEETPEREVKREGEDDCSSPPPATLNPPPSTTVVSTLGTKRPGPRKPRTTLPSIPKGSQAKKITTLDKCAMDWRAHVASQPSDVKNELDVNRRGGGYLEKVDFLKRVEDRREDAFEASKASKRRKT